MRQWLLVLLAPATALASSDDVDETMKALGVEETKFEVRAKDEKKLELPPSDEPVRLNLPLLETTHRDEGQHYLDPFIGREVFPEVAAQIGTRFVARRTANPGESGGDDGHMTLTGRADLSLWLLDVRVPFDADREVDEGSVEMVLKAPFSAGAHRFAPMLIVHAPMREGFDDSVVELAFGYHVAYAGLALKLEVSGFVGSHDRQKNHHSAGMVGWNATLSYLATEAIGIVLEADGSTAISERTGATPPEVGDTVVRILGGLRFFPVDRGFGIGLAGLYTLVPDGYSIERDAGVLFDIGYTFL